jgi:hypothetical protein
VRAVVARVSGHRSKRAVQKKIPSPGRQAEK